MPEEKMDHTPDPFAYFAKAIGSALSDVESESARLALQQLEQNVEAFRASLGRTKSERAYMILAEAMGDRPWILVGEIQHPDSQKTSLRIGWQKVAPWWALRGLLAEADAMIVQARNQSALPPKRGGDQSAP